MVRSPHSAAEWQARLSDLSLACIGAEAGEAEALLHEARRLLAAAPAGWAQVFAGLPPREAFDALLAAGGEAGAALALVEGRGSYMISYGPGGQHLATVVFEGRSEEMSAPGACLALTVLGAMAASIVGAGLGAAGQVAERACAASPRLN